MQTEKIQWKYPNLPPRPQTFQRKISLLDETNPNSALNKSGLRGFYNLAMIFGTIFFITQPIVNFIEKGYFLEPSLYQSFKVDFFFCIMTWPLFFFWSFTSFFLQKLILMGLSSTLTTIFQHLTQSGLFIYSIYIVLQNDWCSTHTTFVVLQACTHFMKMHSYVTVNRDYRDDWIQAKSKGLKPQTNYPENINIKDFLLFMLTPWLVYAQYPRRNTISVLYLLKKIIIIILLLLLDYIIYSEYILPYIGAGDEISMVQLIIRLLLPSTAFILISFYAVFENMCNFFAELSYLDFRQFYEDWWNSTTYEEFNRKWNKPVHNFLYKHVYLEVMIKYKKSKKVAQIVTFLFSAALHELLFVLVFRIFRPVMFGFMIGQVPLIYLTKWMKNNRVGLFVFWFGIILGPGLIIVGYLRSDQKVTNLFTTKKYPFLD